MKQILDKVNEIAEMLNDVNGVPNMEWVKNNVNELQDIVKEICNLPFVSDTVCDHTDIFYRDDLDKHACKKCRKVLY